MNKLTLGAMTAALAACTTASGAADTESQAGADSQGHETTASDSGASRDGGDADAGMGTETGTDDGDGGDPEPILPLTIGRWWEYEPVDGGLLYDCAGPGPYIAEVTGAMTLDGRPAAVMRQAFPECDFDDAYYEDRGGDDIWRFYPAESEPWQPFMLPPEDGLSWEVPPLLLDMRWRFIGQFEVPAGTFDDCWARETSYSKGSQAGQGGDYVYCRGVGLVSLELFFEGGATVQLVDYGGGS